ERVGGAVIAFKTPAIHMLEGAEMAELWDLRVLPTERSRGVGSALFTAAEAWCRQRGCRELKVETQNINVPACQFYAHMGCTLGAIDLHAYSELGEEVQLDWFKNLT
ncbi:MAG: GNAT family N-acetyltransferase, partial [Acidimicrobiales bacterium]